VWVHWGSEQQEGLRYQATYHTYLASGGECYALHKMSVREQHPNHRDDVIVIATEEDDCVTLNSPVEKPNLSHVP